MHPLTLVLMPGIYSICRLGPEAAIPGWAAGPFVSFTRTQAELSVVCIEDNVPPDTRQEGGWCCLMVQGPLDFGLTGILASIAAPLAAAGVSIFAVSSFDTDYVLVKASALEAAIKVLRAAGYIIQQ